MSLKTQHGITTPHGQSTPHKYPFEDENLLDTLNRLSIQLYPTGRAWYRPENGFWDGFHEAINTSFVQLMEQSRLLIDQSIPDNSNFGELDAELWEYRLGLITNPTIDLELRKQAIARKMGHPNNIKARQHPFFIEDQIRKAGFDVYIHENVPPYQTPNDILSLAVGELQHADDTEHGNSTQHGGGSFDVIANSLEPSEVYAVGGTQNLWATFFIGGPNLGDFADVSENRLREFKELVIKLKPSHTAAFTFINYV